MTVYVDNENFSISIDSDILYLKFKEGTIIDLSLAIRVVSERLLVQRGKDFLVLCDISELQSISQPARNYLSKEGSVLKKAWAIFAPTEISKVLANFYLTTSPPKFPAEIFQDLESAISFLKSFDK